MNWNYYFLINKLICIVTRWFSYLKEAKKHTASADENFARYVIIALAKNIY